MAYIEVENINHSFGSVDVLHDVSLEITKGELVSIIGKSGAGKTTLLQIMGTLLKPDSGRVMIKGEDVYKMSERALSDFRNKHVGFIFQFHQLLPEFTALENVLMPAYIGHMPEKDAQARANKLFNDLGIADRKNHKPSQLSGGEKQRVAAARAMIMQPDVIFADEPSGSLDSANRKDLYKILQSLREQFNQTIVVVTHDSELASISDRVLTISDGKII
ncbi:MAG: ABC transporter ATP-binding protein [Paludibacteraceae bacterium]|nr:ABC transporter ATP-binding protein [Paludibacteraceae bacterium]